MNEFDEVESLSSMKEETGNVNIGYWEKAIGSTEDMNIFEECARGAYKCKCEVCICKGGLINTPRA